MQKTRKRPVRTKINTSRTCAPAKMMTASKQKTHLSPCNQVRRDQKKLSKMWRRKVQVWFLWRSPESAILNQGPVEEKSSHAAGKDQSVRSLPLPREQPHCPLQLLKNAVPSLHLPRQVRLLSPKRQNHPAQRLLLQSNLQLPRLPLLEVAPLLGKNPPRTSCQKSAREEPLRFQLTSHHPLLINSRNFSVQTLPRRIKAFTQSELKKFTSQTILSAHCPSEFHHFPQHLLLQPTARAFSTKVMFRI